MKYLAILKDSLYETIDFKLFYVLIGLSSLLILLCFSFTFPMVSEQEALIKNLRDHAGPDFAGGRIDRQRGDIRPGDAAVDVGEVTPVPGDPPRMRLVLTPRVLDSQPEQPPKTEGNSDDEKAAVPKKEQREKSFGKALLATAQQRETLRKAMKGEIGIGTFMNLILQPQAPETADGWKTAMARYLDSVEGVSGSKVVALDGDPAKVPQRFTVEVTVDWQRLPYRRQFGLCFGVWKFDLRRTGDAVFMMQSTLVDTIAGWVGLIVSLIVTAAFVPNMLQKGTLDFLLVKPIYRPTLLIYKYLGGLLFVFLNGAFLVGGTWLAFAVNSGNWSPWYLLSVFVLVFFFAILYSMSVLLGLLTRSPMVAVLGTLAFWFMLFLVHLFYTFTVMPEDLKFEWVKNFPPALTATLDWIHYLLPKPGQLGQLNQMLLAQANETSDLLAMQGATSTAAKISWGETIATSSGFIAVMLGLACWRFSRKDY